MRQENGYYIFIKDEKAPLDGDRFNSNEFQCHCSFDDCVEQKIAKELVDRLTTARNSTAEPIIVTSGYRCEKRQKQLSESGLETAKNSQHVLGNAADVRPQSMESKKTLDEVLDKLFQAMGIANNFTHVDLRSKRVRWSYTHS
jgi:uncharacterized protein YcbK (DUF882 family)